MELSGTYACDIHVENSNLYNQYLKYAYLKIPSYILEYAKIMKVNAERILNNLLYYESTEEYEKVISSFLGVYTNYFAYIYLKNYYSDISLEYEINTNMGRVVIDLASINNNTLNLFEVKATKQLMFNKKHFKKSLNDYLCNDIYGEKYLDIGISLMNQLKKLKNYHGYENKIINIVIFEDCHICKDVTTYIEENNINVIKLPYKIDEIINDLNELMSDICIYGKNIYYKKNYMPIRRNR